MLVKKSPAIKWPGIFYAPLFKVGLAGAFTACEARMLRRAGFMCCRAAAGYICLFFPA